MTPTREWFESRTERFGMCLLWAAAQLPSGYGTASWRENGSTRGRPAHRVSYELFVGPIPEGFEVHHICGVRLCVEPHHLVALSRREHNWVHEAMKDEPKSGPDKLEAIRQRRLYQESLGVS